MQGLSRSNHPTGEDAGANAGPLCGSRAGGGDPDGNLDLSLEEMGRGKGCISLGRHPLAQSHRCFVVEVGFSPALKSFAQPTCVHGVVNVAVFDTVQG